MPRASVITLVGILTLRITALIIRNIDIDIVENDECTIRRSVFLEGGVELILCLWISSQRSLNAKFEPPSLNDVDNGKYLLERPRHPHLRWSFRPPGHLIVIISSRFNHADLHVCMVLGFLWALTDLCTQFYKLPKNWNICKLSEHLLWMLEKKSHQKS